MILNKDILSSLSAFQSLDDSPAMQAIRGMQDSPVMRIWRELDESSAIEAMNRLQESPAMQVIQQIEASPAMRTLREFENSAIAQAFRNIEESRVLDLFGSLEESPAFKHIQSLQESPVIRALNALESSPISDAFSNVADRIAFGYGALTFAEAYEQLISEYEQLSRSDSSEPLEDLAEKVRDQANLAPLTELSAEFYLSVVFAFFLFCLSHMSANESEEKLLERMESLEQTVSTQLEAFHESEATQVFSVVDRPLNLRHGPGVDHQIEEVLSRNQKVRELERTADWVKIQYFDYLSNKNKQGWVHSRYLVRVSHD